MTTHGSGADKQLSYPVTIGHRRFRVDQCRGNCTAVDRKGKCSSTVAPSSPSTAPALTMAVADPEPSLTP